MCAYVAMVVYICCKSLSPMFRLFFKCMLQASLFGCCLCFRTYVAGVLCGCYLCLQCFSSVFLSVSDACFKFSSVFFCMLQVLHPNVLKVNRASTNGIRVESGREHEQLSRACDAGDVWWSGPRVAARCRRVRETFHPRGPMHGRGKTDCSHGRPSERSGASIADLISRGFLPSILHLSCIG
jgi:hypothetical protein